MSATSLGSFVLAMALTTAVVAKGADSPPVHNPTTYWHLVASPDGASHFVEKPLDFKPFAMDGVVAHTFDNAGTPMLVRFKSGTKEDWHNAPMRLYSIVLQGVMEITSSDGKVHVFKPGDIALMDDLNGKGHWNRAIGPDDFVALVVPVADAPSADK